MTDSHQKKQEKTNNILNTVVAGIAGVVAGGVAVASAIVMSDKKNQKKVKEVLVNAKDQATGFMKDLQKQAQDIKGKVEEKEKKIEKTK